MLAALDLHAHLVVHLVVEVVDVQVALHGVVQVELAVQIELAVQVQLAVYVGRKSNSAYR